jgi:AcrR family transcriptional regulator
MRLKRDKEPLSAKDSATMDSILLAAEAMFAKRGLSVSLRDLTTRAKVNLAAVSYYFGSKSGLAHAVFDRLARRVNEGRTRDLERAVAHAEEEGRKLDLHEVLGIFVRPYLDPRKDENGRLLAQLILQHRIEPSDLTRSIIKRHFDPMATRYIEALALSCPHVDAEEFVWRYAFMVGAVVLSVTDLGRDNRVARLSGGRSDARDPDQLWNALMRFLAGGMSAPGPARRRGDKTAASDASGASRE